MTFVATCIDGPLKGRKIAAERPSFRAAVPPKSIQVASADDPTLPEPVAIQEVEYRLVLWDLVGHVQVTTDTVMLRDQIVSAWRCGVDFRG